MADYRATSTEFTAVADAIRTKGGTSAQLTWPNGFVSAVQAIPTGSGIVQPLSVTQNGTYNPPSGVDGYAPVTVNVSGGGGDDWTSLKNYIESSGTQWIDTGYYAKDNSLFELIANINQSNSYYATAFGARTGAGSTAAYKPCYFYVKNNNSSVATINWGANDTNVVSNMSPYYGQKARLRLKKSAAAVELGDEWIKSGISYQGGEATDQYSIFLFSLNQGGSEFGSLTRCNMKLYRLRIYENNTLVHEFLPWQENGAICLKDTITGNIKYNAGTGDFVYGTDS